MRYVSLILLFLYSCSTPSSSGFNSLPPEKRNHFVPFNPDLVNDTIDYNYDNYFVQEITADQVKVLATKFNYTWVVIWAPWCPGPETKEFAESYIKYEKQLADKGIKLIFVAVGYGPEGIRKMAQKLNYTNITFVIKDEPNIDNLKAFHYALNKSYKYRNANHYIFQKDKGLIYTGKDLVMKFEELKSVINY